VTYKWKPGSRINIPAQEAGERLETLQKQYGHLTPQIVVEDARDSQSVFHPAFEWDDVKAAEEYRLEQARYILRHLIVVRQETEKPQEIRAFVVVKEEEQDRQWYAPTLSVLTEPELRRQVLERALRELEAFRRKYKELVELAEVLAAAEHVLTMRQQILVG